MGEDGIAEIKPPVALGDPEETFEVVEDALYDLWSVANELARITPPRPKYYRRGVSRGPQPRDVALHDGVRHRDRRWTRLDAGGQRGCQAR